METLWKRYWFKRLPILEQNAAAWAAHTERHWNLEPYRPADPVPAEEVKLLIRQFMPELLAEFEALVSASPDRSGQAQMIAMHNLRPFFSGCSNSISLRSGYPTLIRNYDFATDGFSGVFRYEPTPDGGWIIGSAECGWGYLDGLNHHGLAVAITFGGSFEVGDGFSIPIIVRYLLRTCATVPEAAERLNALPHRLVQNLSLLDRDGRYCVVYASPDQVTAEHGLLCCTNHQQRIQESGHVEHGTVERFDHLFKRAGDVSPEVFLEPPLHSKRFSDQFGTLYTVEIDPRSGTVHYHWLEGRQLRVSPDSPETEFSIALSDRED
ncbi:C45 family autoproteolytic acyltransferase/hydolase [Cohnella zeiphila]|uniref:Peptidase C45 hydrolase domain-containing protein n=1 Tax=Cohnella zeiphila TaxID=2761120 RepID=A0A7X0STF5_9BACL|nr:C45 family peptidase [Cohnella zeiphila]MBB6734834.1 hypothetical protein [Cohnella zeiphila]